MAKIEDAGEFIPQAKKHLARKKTEKTPAQRSRLAEIWPEPDWKELSRVNRYTPSTLAALAATYWGLGTAPHEKAMFGVEAHEWPAMYDAAIAIVKQVFDEAYDETLLQLNAKAYALAGLNRFSDAKDRMRLSAAGRYGGRRLYPPFSLTQKLAWLSVSMADLGWPEDDSCLRASVGVISTREHALPSDNCWAVITTTPRPAYEKGCTGLTRVEALIAARRVIKDRLAENAKAAGLRKAVTRRASADLEVRVGPDFLGGWDISGQELLETFRLRGVQFGEALSDKEKQRWLNEAFCAFHDLSRIIGFEPAWIGLGGRGRPTLGLAFGARGQGGASAHFEPALWVVNLTRDTGHGACAHEWAHALDSHLAQSTFSSGFNWLDETDFMTEERGRANRAKLARPDAFSAFTSLCDELFHPQDNPFYEYAKRIEAIKGTRKRYWASRVELWARSFEAFIQDELVANGETSPWLVHGTLPSDQHDLSMSAYPLGEQRERLRTLWRGFLGTLAPRNNAAAQQRAA